MILSACFVGAVDDQTILEQGIPPTSECIRFPNVPASTAVSWDTVVQSTPPLARHARAIRPTISPPSSTRRERPACPKA